MKGLPTLQSSEQKAKTKSLASGLVAHKLQGHKGGLSKMKDSPTRRLRKQKARSESCEWSCCPLQGHKGRLIKMKEKRFYTTGEMIQKNHSGWSGVKCKTCGRVTTNAQLSYSMRFYEKPLCRTCQSLESYRTHVKKGGERE